MSPDAATAHRPLDSASFAERGGAARPDRARIVHLGLGNFHRAHQAWYTAHAADAADWGIASFTGRSPQQAEQLRRQDGLYCLVTRGESGDTVEVVGSIVEVQDASRLDRLVELLSDPAVAIVTLTITEAGYRLTDSGTPDTSDPVVVADIAELSRVFAAPPSDAAEGATVNGSLSRLLYGLDARRRADAGPIAVVPCDNVPNNGDFVRSGLLGLAQAASSELATWIGQHVSFVSTSVDRITPRLDGPVPAVEAAGWIDVSPVVTEPFADWVLSGDFPAGRPAWETAGARFVDDLEPWENRKLWLLNGAHSILAFAGLTRGLETVAAAIDDPLCRALVTDFWAETVTHLPEGIEHVEYRRDLLDRFRNPRIEHRLAQIASDATTKVRYRFVAVAERTVAEGADPSASARAVASWMAALRAGVVPADGAAGDLSRALDADDPVRALLELVSPALAMDERFPGLVASALHALQATD